MMNKKIDIEKLEKRNPYKVPKDYFTSLTHNIMDKVEEKETNTFFDFFTLKPLAPTLAMLLIVFSAVWYNNQKREAKIFSKNLISRKSSSNTDIKCILG